MADITKRLSMVESNPPSSSNHWVPPQSSASVSSVSTLPTRSVSPDELVITGFERNTHMKERIKVVGKFLEKLPVSGKHFRIDPKFLHSQICFLVKLPASPAAVISQVLEEFGALNSKQAVQIEVEGKSYSLSLRAPIPPARLKRNAILKQAFKFILDHAKDAKDPIEICWRAGAVKHGVNVLFTVNFEGVKTFYSPLLDIKVTKEELSKALEWENGYYGQRL